MSEEEVKPRIVRPLTDEQLSGIREIANMDSFTGVGGALLKALLAERDQLEAESNYMRAHLEAIRDGSTPAKFWARRGLEQPK